MLSQIPMAFVEEFAALMGDADVLAEFIDHQRQRPAPRGAFEAWRDANFVAFDSGLWLANVDATQIEIAWADLRAMADEAFGEPVGDEIVEGEETVDAYWGVRVLRQPGVSGFTVKLGRERWRAPCADIGEVFAALSINLPPVAMEVTP